MWERQDKCSYVIKLKTAAAYFTRSVLWLYSLVHLFFFQYFILYFPLLPLSVCILSYSIVLCNYTVFSLLYVPLRVGDFLRVSVFNLTFLPLNQTLVLMAEL
jgi:hypothetical protein